MIETQEFTNTYEIIDNNHDDLKNLNQEPMPISNHKYVYCLYVIIDTIVSIIAITVYYTKVHHPNPKSLIVTMFTWGIFNLIINITRIYCAYRITRHNYEYPRNCQLTEIYISLFWSSFLVLLFIIAFAKNIYNTDLKQDLILLITWYSLFEYNVIVAATMASILIYYKLHWRDYI